MSNQTGNPNWVPGVSGNPGGRPKGIVSKSDEIRKAFYEAFDKTGSLDGLITWITEEAHPNRRKEFYKMIIELLPKEVIGAGLEQKIIIIRDKGESDKSRVVAIPEEIPRQQ